MGRMKCRHCYRYLDAIDSKSLNYCYHCGKKVDYTISQKIYSISDLDGNILCEFENGI